MAEASSNSKGNPTDKIYGITNIKSYVPLLLDLDRLNYDSWKELFKTHCIGYSVFDHLEGTSSHGDDPEWNKVDAVVKQWIYGTLTQPLLQSILKPDSTAADVWKAIQDLFHENKESKAMELDDELRNIVIGDSTIMEYCTRLKSISDLLANIGAPVPERNLVIYALNGLSPKYAHIVTTIRHQKPFPSFLEMRSMLTLEERSMIKEQSRIVQASHQDNASSPTVLNTEHQNRGQNTRGNNSGGRGGGRNQRGGNRGGRSGGRNGGRQGRSDQPTTLPQAFNSMSLQDPGNADWYMDTGATTHLHADSGLPDQTNPPLM
ncbi:hypothetical protein L2E82_06292 [Cichorium intybus]|uniref:Uncharacterized protein n=1 Tax=Cichorium intybus TaxID=13427 RepID=A0ACB9HAV0_CICIN|nr:hypothetical protein L2E82_06292 [Cichorium intybus]